MFLPILFNELICTSAGSPWIIFLKHFSTNYVGRKRFTMRSNCLLEEACKSLAISLIDAGGNDDKTLGVREGWNEVVLLKD